MSSFQAVGCFVSIRADPEPPDPTAGSLYIPQEKGWLPDRGTVLTVGRGQVHADGQIEENDVKPGDYVVFPPQVSDRKGETYDVDGEDLIVIHSTRILAVIVR